MSAIAFGGERFKRVKEVYGKWWAREGDRPVVGAIVPDRQPSGREGVLPDQSNVGLHVPIDSLLDGIERHYSRFSFLGDAFPVFNLDCFGPGLVSAFLGAKLDNSTGRVWFHPARAADIDELDFSYDPGNEWLRYVKEFCRKGYERFGDTMLFSMPDLGGVLDILSVFLPGEELLLALYDSPERVKYLAGKITELWKTYYDEIAESLNCRENGYTDWSCIYCEKPSYVIQCDFSYMIGEDMFREFALADLKRQCEYLDRTIYHLDGVNELNHLGHLLSIERLDAVQWVPGTGNKPVDEWPEVYRKIAESGKGIQVLCHGFDRLQTIIEQTKRPELMLHQQTYHYEYGREESLKWLKSFGVEP